MKENWEVEGPKIVVSKEEADQRIDGKEPITYSILRTGLTCPKKMYWRYYQGFRSAPSDNQLLGSAFHRGMELQDPLEAARYYRDNYPGFIDESVTTKNNMLAFMVRGAMARWNYEYKEIRPEQTFRLPLVNPDTDRPSRNYYWAGKIDAVGLTTEDQWFLIERKTTGQSLEKYFDLLVLDHQLTGYLLASSIIHAVDLEGVDYQVARKPSIRQKKQESLEDFIRRLDQDYIDRPEFYFHRKIVPFNRRTIEDFQRTLWDTSQLFHWFEKNDTWPMNTSRCGDFGGCPYIPLCTHQKDAQFQYTRDYRRAPELEEEAHDGVAD